jgi:5-methylcytosine-specific restriction endonuclease McrA
MTLIEYLDKYRHSRALTSAEFAVIGLRFPQKKGWVNRLGGMELTVQQFERMNELRELRQKKRSDNRDAKASRKEKPTLRKLRSLKREIERLSGEHVKRAKQESLRISKNRIDPRSDAFLSSFEWRAVRMMALELYGPICQCCGASPKTGAVINVDHVKPRKLYPELALEVGNLQILCHECNHGKGNWSQTDWRDAVEPDIVISTLNRIKSKA